MKGVDNIKSKKLKKLLFEVDEKLYYAIDKYCKDQGISKRFYLTRLLKKEKNFVGTK